MNRLTVEFCIIQERQLTKPAGLAVAIRKEASKSPIRHCDVNQTLTTASIENNCVKGVQRRGRLSDFGALIILPRLKMVWVTLPCLT